MSLSWENICYIVFLEINSKYLQILKLYLTVKSQPLLLKASKNYLGENLHLVSNSLNMPSSK